VLAAGVPGQHREVIARERDRCDLALGGRFSNASSVTSSVFALWEIASALIDAWWATLISFAVWVATETA
jgi:hypothetical protein